MNTHQKEKFIFLLGSYGRGNLGDDAFLYALSKLITKHKIVINASDDAGLPLDADSKVLTVSTEMHRDIFKKLKYLIKSKHIMYGGGDMWVELHKDTLKRKSLWKMVAVNMTARLLGKQVHYISCGAGNLSGLSLRLARLSAYLSNNIVYRDSRSQNLIKKKGIVLPDVTVTLKKNYNNLSESDARHTIGISLTYNIDSPEENFEKVITSITSSIERISNNKTKIILFPMLISDAVINDDLWASEILEKRLSKFDVEIDMTRKIPEFIDNLRRCDVIIGMRLHASILGLWAEVPVIGISYRPKVRQFYREFLADELALDISDSNKLDVILYKVLAGKYTEVYKHGYKLGSVGKKQYEKVFTEL